MKLVVIGLIENGKGEFLISKRNEPSIKDAHLKWDFIGGKIEWGESPEEALKREILEETFLNVEIMDMIPCCDSRVWDRKTDKLHVVVIGYRCRIISGEARIGDSKIKDLKFIKKDDFDKYDFLPTINLFLEKINFFN